MSKKPSKKSTKGIVPATNNVIPSINTSQISSSRSGQNKKTEEIFSVRTYAGGQTVKLTQSKEGVREATITEPPEYATKEERDKIITEFSKKHKTQVEIAEIMNISQSTVSNVLRKSKKK